jgi:hypothetical protein
LAFTGPGEGGSFTGRGRSPDDCIAKPFSFEELPAGVGYRLENAQ